MDIGGGDGLGMAVSSLGDLQENGGERENSR
jgi:hypothetical protein